MSKIYIKRNWNYIGMAVKFRVVIDNVEYPEVIANNQIIEIDIKPGTHELAIKQMMNPKTKTTFTVDADEEIYFETGVSKMIYLFMGITFSAFIAMQIGRAGLILALLLFATGTIGSLIYIYALKKQYYVKEVRRAKIKTLV